MKETERLETTIKYYLGGIAAQYPIIKLVLNEKPKRILEVGGCGYMNTYLSKSGYNVVGIDISSECVRWCRIQNKRLGGKQGRFFIADGFRLPFNDSSFDVAYSQGVIEHFSDVEIISILKESLRVAKVVIFSVPSYYHKEREYEGWGHPEFLKAEEWLKILKSFNIIKYQYYGDNFVNKLQNIVGVNNGNNQILFKLKKSAAEI